MGLKELGFTLVELAIVIVIIGLLVAGVLQGQALVEQAKIIRTIGDIRKYSAAMETFRGKYNAIPGDMRNAYSLLNSSGGNTACGINNVVTAASTTWEGCNGDGDGLIGGVNNLTEATRVWVHLTLSNILPGLMTYKPATGYFNLVSKPTDLANAPSAHVMDYAVYDFSYSGRPSSGGGTYLYYGQSGFFLRIGYPSGQGYDWLDSYRNGAILRPETAEALDRKIDDGLPGVGNMLAARAGGINGAYMGSCTTNWGNSFSSTSGNQVSADTSNTYLLTENSTSCSMMYRISSFN